MPQKTFKLVEIVGVSDESIQQAVRNAVRKARQTLRNIDWFEVTGIRGYVRPDGEPEFQVQIKLGFRLLDLPVTAKTSSARSGSGAVPSRAPGKARKKSTAARPRKRG